jgi:hypothetical protein
MNRRWKTKCCVEVDKEQLGYDIRKGGSQYI